MFQRRRLISNFQSAYGNEVHHIYVKRYFDVQYCLVKKLDNRSIKLINFPYRGRTTSHGGLILLYFVIN